VKPVRLSSLEVLQNWDARGEASQSVRARATEHALGHEMHVPVLAEASTALQTQSADVCSMDPTPDTRGPQATPHSHLDVIVLGRAHIQVQHCQRFRAPAIICLAPSPLSLIK